MLSINKDTIAMLSKVGSRGAFGKAMVDIGQEMPNVVVMTANLCDATRVREFSRKWPERFVQVGIAEQNMMGMAAGLALAGDKIPVATTFAAFASMRACEQVRTDIGYMNLNVKIMGADAGVVMGTLGNTHFGREDAAIFRSMPNIVILSPADGLEIFKATWAAMKHQGPVYIRLCGGKSDTPIIYDKDYDFEIGKAITLREGTDVSLVATGMMVHQALLAADQLKARGISARVIDVHTIKPFDTATILQAARQTRLMVTVEEHTIIGGLGSAAAEVIAENGGCRLVRMGIPDRYDHPSSYGEILRRLGLTADGIVSTTLANLK